MRLFNALPIHTPVWSALKKIYGVGRLQAEHLCGRWGIGLSTRVEQLPSWLKTKRIRELEQGIEIPAGGSENRFEEKFKLVTEKNLRREIQADLFRLESIRAYRGIRHIEGLPAHGQRTHTNGAKRLRVHKLKVLQQKRLSKQGGSKKGGKR